VRSRPDRAFRWAARPSACSDAAADDLSATRWRNAILPGAAIGFLLSDLIWVPMTAGGLIAKVLPWRVPLRWWRAPTG